MDMAVGRREMRKQLAAFITLLTSQPKVAETDAAWFAMCIVTGYIRFRDKNLPAQRHPDVLRERRQCRYIARTCGCTGPPIVAAKRCVHRIRHEHAGLEAASFGWRVIRSLVGMGEWQLAADFRI